MSSPFGLVAGTWYPPRRQPVADAIACGDVRAKTAAELGYTELPVSDGVAPPDMAVRAARGVLDLAGTRSDELAMVLHASVHHQGHDAWSASHYIANELGADRAVPIGLLQQCNGGAIGIELAADRLRADPHAGPVLVTTADRFVPPSWHRWLTDYGMATGDGATAVLVHRGDRPSDLLLLASATTVAADLEVMHRGDDGLEPHPLGHGPRIDVKRTKRAFIAAYGVDRFVKTAYDRIAEAVAAALALAGLSGSDLRYAVLPRLGTKAMAEAYVPPLADQVSAEVLDLGRATGHLGAGDLNANLADLARGEWLGPGDHALILNGGGGFTFTAMVVSRPGSTTPSHDPSEGAPR